MCVSMSLTVHLYIHIRNNKVELWFSRITAVHKCPRSGRKKSSLGFKLLL